MKRKIKFGVEINESAKQRIYAKNCESSLDLS